MKNFILLSILLIIFFLGTGWAFCSWTYPYSHRGLIKQVSSQYDLDPLLVGALIFIESRYQKEAISPVGAMGLMQLMPSTAMEQASKIGLNLNTENEYLEPKVNIQLGCAYLAQLNKNLSGEPLWKVLASYNAGISKVKEWEKRGEGNSKKIIQYRETKDYVERILMVYRLLLFWRIWRIV